MGIFKEYDIRGVYGKELNAKNAEIIGKAAAQFFKQKSIVVGRDGRISSPALARNLIEGIRSQGCKVIDIGIVSTPMLYFTAIRKKIPGIMTTASHNPKEYNGFKFISSKGDMIYAKNGLLKIKEFADKISEMTLLSKTKAKNKIDAKYKNAKNKTKSKSKGRLIKEKENALKEYKRYILSKFRRYKPHYKKFKIVLDFSNGSGAVFKRIFDNLGIKNTKYLSSINGNFPVHQCNPQKPEVLAYLQKKMKKAKADLGIVFDGDADRVRFISEKGSVLKPDLIFLLLAKNELKHKRNPNKKILYYDLRFSRIVHERIRAWGGRPVMMRVGNPFFKKALKRDNSILAAEYSGHIMFKENYRIDDSLYAALKLITFLSMQNTPVSELAREFDRYYTSGEINIKVKDKNRAIERLKKRYKNKKQKFVDGISVYDKGYWFNIRKSNTEPVIRLLIEAGDKETLNRIKNKLLTEIS